MEPTNFNYAHALPNKLFEFIQARLAIAISPSAEMKALVEKHNLGVISDNFEIENLANKIKRLSMADVSTFKLNSEMAAHSENAETYGHLFLDHFSKL